MAFPFVSGCFFRDWKVNSGHALHWYLTLLNNTHSRSSCIQIRRLRFS